MSLPARGLAELIDTVEPAWPLVEEWLGTGSNQHELLPVERARGEAALLALQVTTRSTLGAVTLHTGGLLVGHGWLRLLGAGCERLPGSLLSWNGYEGPAPEPRLQGALVVAHDVAGGFFVLDCGGLGTPERSVVYAQPDTLRWVDLGGGYTDFVRWALQGDLVAFYADLRWPGWEADAAAVDGERGLHFAPPLWTVEGRAARLDPRSRRAVPLRELWSMWHEMRRQLDG